MVVKYSNEELLDQLRAHYKKNGKISSTSFNLDKTICSVKTIILRFGSWNNALERAGLHKNEYSKKEIVEQLRIHYKKNNKITKISFNLDKTTCSADTVIKHFGSWRKGLEELGFVKPKEYVEYNKEKLFLILKKMAKNGRLKNRTDMKKIECIPSDNYVMKLWNWVELSSLLEIETPHIMYTKKMLIEKYQGMKTMEKYRNKKIASLEYTRETSVSTQTISRHFGSWNDFCVIVGNKGWKSTKIIYTNEELLKLYIKVSKKVGKEETGATGKELKKELGLNPGIFSIRFGGLNNLRRMLNLCERNEGTLRYTKEEIKKKLLEKYKEYGRILLTKELKEIHERSNEEEEWIFPGYTTILKYFQTTKMSEVWEEVLKNKKI